MERSDGILEIASLGFVCEQVSGVRIDTRHRPSERDRLLLVSEQEQQDQAATNCDQVSPILRTTPFQKPEIWCSTCGRDGSHWKLPKPGESSELWTMIVDVEEVFDGNCNLRPFPSHK